MINSSPPNALPVLPNNRRPSVQAKIRYVKTNNTAFSCSNLADQNRFQALVNNHALLTNEVQANQANQADQPPWAAAMEARLNGRIQGVENRIAGVEDRIQGVEDRIQDVQDRIAVVEDRLNRVVETITALPARVSDLIYNGKLTRREQLLRWPDGLVNPPQTIADLNNLAAQGRNLELDRILRFYMVDLAGETDQNKLRRIKILLGIDVDNNINMV